MIIGIVASSAWQVEKLQIMRPGESVTVGGFDFKFIGAAASKGPNYAAVGGIFQVTQDGAQVALLKPESRTYQDPPMETTEAAIKTGWSGDLYAVIGDPTNDRAWSTRFYYKPMIHWIWLGALIMVFGGLISLSDRRYRVGTPARRERGSVQKNAVPAVAGN